MRLPFRFSPRRALLYGTVALIVTCLLWYLMVHGILRGGQKSMVQFKLEQQLKTYGLTPTNDQEKKEEQYGFQRNGFNQFRSDRLPLDREIPDTRDPRCLDKGYSVNVLPKASVIIIFYNEALSTLLRTVTSVLNRSPAQLVQEIILVDDSSNHDDLKGPLEDSIATQDKVKLIRHMKREGLVRARLTGAESAIGPALVFLDSHCEANVGWLEPLLYRVFLNSSTVVCPVIDVIGWEKLDYSTIRGPPRVRGGFNWDLRFKWKAIPEYEQKRRVHDETREVQSPTMAGGLFAIDRAYFYKLGAYDTGMDIWGGENLEMSFRIWMCGGTLELLPCSRVGHIFRKSQPYSFPDGVDNTLVRNNMRLAEVWMDSYKEHFYAKRPSIKGRNYGDVSERHALRERLKCHSFEWYLKNVYSELRLPNENLIYGGAIRNPTSSMCLDTFGRKNNGAELGLYTCHGQAGNQEFAFTDIGELQFEEDKCLDVSKKLRGGHVQIYGCHGLGGNQQWEYNEKSQQLLHVLTNLCLQRGTEVPVMNPCDENNLHQKWTFSRNYHDSTHQTINSDKQNDH